MDHAQNGSKEITTLGGGCFWCLQPVFQSLVGVEKVEAGYSGGRLADPTYQQVCAGTTGHAEVVQVTFSLVVISFAEILGIFFTVHDPTTRNRQGADVGTQYRSAVFYHTEEQREVAARVIGEIEAKKIWDAPIVTELVPFQAFYRAEDYHQDYFAKNPEQGYCKAVVAPKVAKFRKTFSSKLR